MLAAGHRANCGMKGLEVDHLEGYCSGPAGRSGLDKDRNSGCEKGQRRKQCGIGAPCICCAFFGSTYLCQIIINKQTLVGHLLGAKPVQRTEIPVAKEKLYSISFCPRAGGSVPHPASLALHSCTKLGWMAEVGSGVFTVRKLTP